MTPNGERSAALNILGLELVIIFVTDVARSVRWYQEVMGLTLVSHHGDFATLSAGESRIALHGGTTPNANLANAGSMPVFNVEDYAAAKEYLEARGCEFVFENSTASAQFGTFLDPDENRLQIMQRR